MTFINDARINVMVSNMDVAVEFYTDILNLELLNRWDNHYAEVRAPGLLIGLHPSSDKVVKGNNMSIGLGVKQFDDTIKALEAKDLKFNIEKDGWIRLAYFKDPDGNELFLAENK